MLERLQRIGKSRLLDVGAIILALIIAFKIFLVLPERSKHNDFAHYYVTSRFYLEDRNPYETPMQSGFQRYSFHFAPHLTPRTASNPPLLLIGFSALTIFPPNIAYSLWFIIQFFSLAIIIYLTRWILSDRMSSRGFLFFCSLTIGSATVYWHFFFSQVQLPLTALTLFAFVLLRSGRATVACLLITLASLIKIYPIVLLPWFLWHGGKNMVSRLKLAVLCLIQAGFLMALTGIELWQSFFQTIPEIKDEFAINYTFNYSMPSFIANFASSFLGYNHNPELENILWSLAMGSSLLIMIISYAFCWFSRNINDKEVREKEFAILCIAMLLSSLLTWGHYLVFLIFPFTVVAVQIARKPNAKEILILLLVWLSLNCLGTLENQFLDKHITIKVIVNYIPLFGILGLGFFCAKNLHYRYQVENSNF